LVLKIRIDCIAPSLVLLVAERAWRKQRVCQNLKHPAKNTTS
jgi:hypothetical protein